MTGQSPRPGSSRLASRTAAPVGPAVHVPGVHDAGRPDPVEREQIRVSLGAVLRQARGEVGLSQRRLAALAGCDRRSVERLEAGQRRPTSALLDALAQALMTPPGWSVNRARVDVMRVRLAVAAGPSLVESTPGGARRRRRRLRKARLAANRAASPLIRAGLAAQQQRTAGLLADAQALANAARRYL